MITEIMVKENDSSYQLQRKEYHSEGKRCSYFNFFIQSMWDAV